MGEIKAICISEKRGTQKKEIPEACFLHVEDFLLQNNNAKTQLFVSYVKTGSNNNTHVCIVLHFLLSPANML